MNLEPIDTSTTAGKADHKGPSTVYVFVDEAGNALGFGESIHMARKSEKAVKYIRADLAGEVGA